MFSVKELDNQLFQFTEKYPFLVDPIVLMKPKEEIDAELLLKSQRLDLTYPYVEYWRSKLDELQRDFDSIYDFFRKTEFLDVFWRGQYDKRLQDFLMVIELLRIFYYEDEKRKFDIIKQYFGIDYDVIQKALDSAPFYKQIQLTEHQGSLVNPLLDKMCNAQEVKQLFDSALVNLGMQENWKVVLSDTVVSVVHTNFTRRGGEIHIPKTYSKKLKLAIELVAHEIDAHCVQFGANTNYGLLSGSIRSSQSEPLLEGLAVFLESVIRSEFFGESSYNVQNHKYRWQLLQKDISLEEFLAKVADRRLIRFFRGFFDFRTYINVKDFSYLQGMYQLYKEKDTLPYRLLSYGVVNDEILQYMSDYPATEKEYNRATNLYLNTII